MELRSWGLAMSVVSANSSRWVIFSRFRDGFNLRPHGMGPPGVRITTAMSIATQTMFSTARGSQDTVVPLVNSTVVPSTDASCVPSPDVVGLEGDLAGLRGL
jgi:hypothetical protein